MRRKIYGLCMGIALCGTVLFGCGEASENNDTAQTEAQREESAGGDTSDNTDTGNDAADSEDSGLENADNTDSGENSEENTEEGSEYEIPEVAIEPYEIPDNEAFAFVRSMKIGWNLGNTFDAYNDSGFVNELDSETCWVSVATTKEMIDDIKEAGFQTMRLPVTWHGHLIDDDYTISEVWLDRVQEVLDYAIDNDMYVILNIHHDNSKEYMYPDSAHLEQSVKFITSIWTQLSARFADYDEHLIFESMNEPRLVGSDYEWWLDNSKEECQDAVECINTLNQTFVDVVRASGGNNEQRYLMVPGYDASADGALNNGFALPADADGVENRILVSVHAYTPYNFALEAGSVTTFDSDSTASTRDIDTFMDKLYTKFISNGIPVVIGEFGARDKDGNVQDRVDYATYYIAAARARGMTCVWWDNNAFSGSGENFGLYYRRGGYFVYPDIVTGLMKYAESE